MAQRNAKNQKAINRPTEKFRGVLTLLLPSGDHVDVIEYGASIAAVSASLSKHLVQLSSK